MYNSAFANFSSAVFVVSKFKLSVISNESSIELFDTNFEVDFFNISS